jgi:hypothetical protein
MNWRDPFGLKDLADSQAELAAAQKDLAEAHKALMATKPKDDPPQPILIDANELTCSSCGAVGKFHFDLDTAKQQAPNGPPHPEWPVARQRPQG